MPGSAAVVPPAWPSLKQTNKIVPSQIISPYTITEDVPVRPEKVTFNPNVIPHFVGKPSAFAAQNPLPSQVQYEKPAAQVQPQPQPVPVVPKEEKVPLELKPDAFVKPAVPLPPASQHPPQIAALRPDETKQPVAAGKGPVGSNKSLYMASGSDTSTGTETSVGANALTEAKTDSKLPALQKPHILATLNNLADAGGEPGKSGLSSEVALATGSDLGTGKISKPTAQKFVKEPKYEEVEKPEFEKPKNPFALGSSMTSGSSAGAGAETESETVVGAGAQVGSDTQIGKNKKEKPGPKLAPYAGSPMPEAESKEAAVAKAIGDVPVFNIVPKPHLDSFVKTNKQNLGSSLKALSLHAPLDKGVEYSMAISQHNDLPNTVIAGHRAFQSVSDVVSDSSNQLCGERRDCLNKASQDHIGNVNGKSVEVSNDTVTLAATQQFESTKKYESIQAGAQVADQGSGKGAETTSNEPIVTQLSSAKNNTGAESVQPLDEATLKQLPAREKLHKFFGEIKVDNKKMFYISGTASEDKDIVYAQTDTSGLINQNDVRKHNIGFNVVLPSNVVKQLPAPKFKERAKVESSDKQHKAHVGEKTVIHPKSKSAIKKVFDMIGDRTRKMKVESAPSKDKHILTSKTTIATVNGNEMQGEAGDIGATKPLKGKIKNNAIITFSLFNVYPFTSKPS